MSVTITTMEPPQMKRGRAHRLDDAAIDALVAGVQSGSFLGDNEPVVKRSTAYQRATAARKLLQERDIKARSRVWTDANGKFLWAVGPKK